MALFEILKDWLSPTPESSKVDYSGLTVKELRDLVKEQGNKPRKLNKAELVKLLENN